MASVGDRRVLVIVQNLPVPFDRRVWLESTTLQQAGYEVTVICPKLKGFNESYERLEDIDIYRYAMPLDPTTHIGFIAENLLAILRVFFLTIRIAMRGRGFDVIHSCNPPETYWTVGLFWRAFGKKYLFDHHDLSPEMYAVKFGRSRLLRTLLLLLEKATFKVAAISIATNESHKRIAVERGGMDPDRVFIVRSGPDTSRFTRYPPNPSWKKGKQHLIAFLGVMGDQDGVDGLIKAVQVLREEMGRHDFHCVLIGGGTQHERLKRLATELGVDDICTFTGVVSDDELCRILSSADIGVDPVPKSEWSDQSTMNKIMEYMYFGLPIVAFDLVETRVSANGAALYAQPNSAKSLAEKIGQLLSDAALRREKSKRASKRLVEELSWEHSVPALLAAYEQV